MTRFAVVVPARRESSRLPGKMLADIGGAPMIARTLQRAAKSAAARVVAATDDDGIAAAARAAGFEVAATGAHDSGSSRVCEAAEILGMGGDDIVVNLQGDEPFMEPEHLSALADLLSRKAGAACATLARPLRSAAEFADAGVVKAVLDGDGFALYFSRAPIPFPREGGVPASALAHLGVYAYRVGELRRFARTAPSELEEIERLEQLRILHWGGRIAVLKAESQSIGVDAPEDLKKARERWKKENPEPVGG